jgi:hypothetical protein
VVERDPGTIEPLAGVRERQARDSCRSYGIFSH